MSYGEVPLGNLVSKCETWNPKKERKHTFNYIDLSSVDKDAKAIIAVERLLCSEAPSRARQLIESNDVLVATVRPNLNGVALASKEHKGMIASTGFCVLRPVPEELDSRFLFQWVKTGIFIQRMIDVSSGANYPAVSDTKVKASTIPLPPLPEQKRIARILDQADALRAKRREAIAKLDTFLQSTFLDMFGDPVKWSSIVMASLASEGRGTFSNGPFGSNLLSSELTKVGVPVIYIRDISGAEYKRVSKVCVTEKKAAELDTCQILPGDVLITKVGDPPGVSAVYPQNEPFGIITQDVIRIRPKKEKINGLFLSAYLNSEYGKRMISEITVEATRARFGLGDFKKKQIPVPPLQLQNQFAEIVTRVEAQKQKMREHLTQLDTLFASLQSRAFNGDL